METKIFAPDGYFVGIDTGTLKCGLCLIDGAGSVKDSLLLKPEGDLFDRIAHLFEWTYEALELWCREICGDDSSYLDWDKTILAIGIEEPWVGKNRQTAITLGAAYGSIIASCAPWKRYRVAPSQAKKALTGNGKASKEEMIRFANAQGMNTYSDDEADAFGVALAAREMWIEENLK